ncbi:hypothetical protein OF83DRAFT_1129826 [Amylostereum chailletii]|nr:hypothetical protein OF83DRAFT_1129826 [Amylostereum chailletii]
MSTASLPRYTAPPDFNRTPTYTAEPQAQERRLAHTLVYQRQRPTAEFVKQDKKGIVSLRLLDQIDGAAIPVYGVRGPVEGVVELAKVDGISSVTVRVEGALKLKEVAEGGTTTTMLCNETITLWRKGVDPSPCPSSFNFSVVLPTDFTDEKDTYPLPASYEAHLSGLPGFQANVDYAVVASVSKTKMSALGLGQSVVSTPFVYYPRTCPSTPLPPPMLEFNSVPGLREAPEWKAYESTIATRTPGGKDIQCKFYIPKSHVFCMSERIPFHIAFVSSAVTLASLLPFLPASGQAPGRSSTRIQVLRQTSVDVKNDYVTSGTNTELWRVFNIGEGVLKRTVDGPRWLCFSGEITIKPEYTVGGFKAGGLWVKDCIVFSITPPDTLKGPIGDLRQVIPLRLVTDPWTSEAYAPRVSPPGSDELVAGAPSFHYDDSHAR